MSTLSMLKFRASIFAAALTFASLSPASHAQDVGMLGQVSVPFAFESGSHHFAPGVYAVRMENEHTLRIQGRSESGLAMTSMEDNGQPAKTGKAVFQKYGDQYFLTEISIAGKSRYLHLRGTNAERLLPVAGQTAPTGIEIALSGTSR